jgi:predicted metal-dependent HD superfamily phosphohydrolase
MERIFKTDYFFNKLEVQAKKNLKQELIFLEG